MVFGVFLQERKEIELRWHHSKSMFRPKKTFRDVLDDDLRMPRIPAVFYEPKVRIQKPKTLVGEMLFLHTSQNLDFAPRIRARGSFT